MKNPFDTRVRGADEIFADLRMLRGDTKGPCVLAVLGTHKVDEKALADAIKEQWDEIVKVVGFEPKRIMTGCVDVGTEKAARLVAKKVTGNTPVVIHRPEMTYGVKEAEEIRDMLMAREADALLVVGKANKHARQRFIGWHKVVHEIEIE